MGARRLQAGPQDGLGSVRFEGPSKRTLTGPSRSFLCRGLATLVGDGGGQDPLRVLPSPPIDCPPFPALPDPPMISPFLPAPSPASLRPLPHPLSTPIRPFPFQRGGWRAMGAREGGGRQGGRCRMRGRTRRMTKRRRRRRGEDADEIYLGRGAPTLHCAAIMEKPNLKDK